jgi:preprotein translocase subunit SecE
MLVTHQTSLVLKCPLYVCYPSSASVMLCFYVCSVFVSVMLFSLLLCSIDALFTAVVAE